MVDSPTIDTIIARAGGPAAIAGASEGFITKWSVYKWPQAGIPDRHWPLVMRLAAVTADEMLAANIAARSTPPHQEGVQG